jgi:uncharacterized membrane protein
VTGAVILARVLHVIGVAIWIGGVGFVTAVLIPACAALPAEQAQQQFEQLERRFAWIARAMVLLVGATGFCMMAELDLWPLFRQASFWWLHAMVAVWTIFAVILFIVEPLGHRRFAERRRRNPAGSFRLVRFGHWFLLTVSLIAIAGAVAGAHGYALFQ